MNKLLLALIIALLPALAGAQSFREAQYKTLATVAAGSVTASYATALSNTKPLRMLDVVNTADCLILISFDASTNHFIVPAQTSLTLGWNDFALYEKDNVSIKYSGSACTTGSVYFSGVY